MVDKTVRVRFTTDGTERVKRDMSDVNKEGDKLSSKRITPSLSLGGLKTTKLSIRDMGVDLDKLGAKKVTPEAGLSDAKFKATMDQILKSLVVFSKKRSVAEADVNDDKARSKLLKLEVKMDDLSRKTAKPDIDLMGAKKALADMLTINAEMDKLSHKVARMRISVSETENKSSIDRLKKLAGSATRGIGGLFGGGGGGGEGAASGAAGAAEGAAGGGSGMLNLAPLGGVSPIGAGIIAGLGAWAAALVPALTALGLGLGPAFGGALLVGMSKNSKGKMVGPLAEFAKDMLGTLREAAQPIAKVLPGIISKLGMTIRKLPLKQMFADSIPILRMVVSLMGKMAQNIVPVLNSTMRQLTPVLPLMSRGLMFIVRSLTDFIRDLGPGIKPSAQVFLVTAKLLDWTMRGLAVVCVFMAKAFVDTGRSLHIAFVDSLHAVEVAIHAVRTGFDVTVHQLSAAWNWFYREFMYRGNLFRQIEGIWDDIWRHVKAFGLAIWNGILDAARNFWHDLVNTWNAIRNGVVSAWNNCFNAVRNFFRSTIADVTNWARSFWHDLVNIWNSLKSDISHVWDVLWAWASNRFHNFTNFAGNIASSFWGDLRHIWNGLKDDITKIWDALWNWAGDRFHSLTSGIENLALGLWHGTTRTFRSLDNDVRRIFGGTWSAIKSLADRGAGWVVDAINGLGSAWNKVAGFLHLPKVPHLDSPKFAMGGDVGYRVPGTGRGDRIPALLEPTEVVIPSRVAERYASQLKQDGIPGFQRGGVVGADGWRRFARGGKGDSGGGPGSNTGKGGALPPGEARGKSAAGIESGSLSFGGIISDLLSLGRKALVAPAVAAIRGAEGLVGHIGFEPIRDIFDSIGNFLIDKLEGAIAAKEASMAGGGAGTIPMWFKKTFKNDPYKWGGNSTTSGADCSGATLLTYKHFGIANGMPRTAASQYDWSNKISKAVPGALVFLQGSDGTNDRSGAGHVGIAVDGRNYMSEYDTQVGFRQGPYDGAHTFGLPRGWDIQRFNNKFNQVIGGIHTGNMMADGRTIYGYLMNNIFHGDKIASAGALASMWGESMWNPESAGTGGWGLMGWTGNFRDRRTGNAQRDMRMELPLIGRYIRQFGDQGAIREMMRSKTVLAAANIWGPQVERFGINDVHPEGLSLAKRIAGLANGGWINEPIAGVGLRSGMGYTLGEHEAEYVTPASKMGRSSGGGVCIQNFYLVDDTNPDASALKAIQKIRDYKRHHGNKPTGIG